MVLLAMLDLVTDSIACNSQQLAPIQISMADQIFDIVGYNCITQV